MRRNVTALVVGACCSVPSAFAQTTPMASATNVWNSLANPAMDPQRFAQLQNVEIKRDRVSITLIDGTIQFAKEGGGVVFGAVFHGNGRILLDPPNPIEAQQLRLFTKQDKLDMIFTEAAFSFNQRRGRHLS